MSIFNRFKKSDAPEEKKNQVTDKTEVKPEAKSATEVKVAKPAKTVKPAADKTVAKKVDQGILIRPLITEKATNLGQLNQYVFEVEGTANKIQVAHAIEARYGVKPLRINMISNRGKSVRYGMSLGRTKDRKKAVVFLAAGKSIQIREGV